MAAASDIEWTEATWPVVQGCDYESPGCAHCYAVPLIWRLAHNPNAAIAAPLQGLVERRGDDLVWTGKVALRRDRLGWPAEWKKPRQIFIPSHGDLFHPDVPDSFIDEVHVRIAQERRHTFQLLAKRSDRMRAYYTRLYAGRPIDLGGDVAMVLHQPLPNLWLGVSVEDRKRLPRIDDLRATPAALRFLSLEPLLEDLGAFDLTGIGWVIAGGESGARARPMHPDWPRSVRDRCAEACVPFFFKQWGEWHPNAQAIAGDSGFTRLGKKHAGRLLDGIEHSTFPEVPA